MFVRAPRLVPAQVEEDFSPKAKPDLPMLLPSTSLARLDSFTRTWGVIPAKKSAPEQKSAPRSKNGALLRSTYFSHYVVGTMAEASRANRRPPKPLPTLPLP